MLASLLEKHILYKMGKITGQPQRGILIRPANASVFKKTPSERKYNTIIKSHLTVQNLLEGSRPLPPNSFTNNDLDGPVKVEPRSPSVPADGNNSNNPIKEEIRYTKQTLTTIQGCLDIAGKNLEDESVQVYLINTFGETEAQQIFQERTSIQDQLEQLFEQIKNPNISNPPTGSIEEVSGSKG